MAVFRRVRDDLRQQLIPLLREKLSNTGHLQARDSGANRRAGKLIAG